MDHADLKLSDDEETLHAIRIDGKTLCASAIHLLAAVDHQTGCVLSQCRVGEKTNEHKAPLELLRSMVLKRRVIVGNSFFCQRDLRKEVVCGGGGRLLRRGEREPTTLLWEIEHEFAAQDAAFPLHAARTTV